jgi:hypothetical protein
VGVSSENSYAVPGSAVPYTNRLVVRARYLGDPRGLVVVEKGRHDGTHDPRHLMMELDSPHVVQMSM